MSKSSRPQSRLNRRPQLMRLEDRTTPSVANFTPATHFSINPDFNATTAANGPVQPIDVGLSYLNAHASEFEIASADLNDVLVRKQYQDNDTGIFHLYLRQRVNGLEVQGADFSIGIAANGSVISAGGGLVSGLASRVGTFQASGPMLSPVESVQIAARELGLPADSKLQIVDGFVGPVKSPPTSYTISAPTISASPIPVSLRYVPTPDGSAALSWHVIIDAPTGAFWGEATIDVQGGAMTSTVSYVHDAQYQVVPNPTNESPQDGGFTLVHNQADPQASPFGWHDTNGVAGAEFTDTRGNNVVAHIDRDANSNVPDPSPPRPNGGANLDFSAFTFDPTQAPTVLQNQNAAMVNLFYMNNVLHDVHYKYGFTEAAGNFQTNNYGNGGLGNDAVLADAQDGSGTNNANFGTPNDGSAPRMQMYIWTAANPDRDSDLDNGVIIHEYGHGVSHRLTNAGNAAALDNIQSRGMGEGWSDWWALMMTQRATDTINSSHGIGTYVSNQAQTGTGIRIRPYSYNMTIDPLMWDSYGTSGTTPYGITRSTAVHRTGTVWASTLWDMNWLLINKYGFDSNLYTGWSPNPGPANAGNKLAMRLVSEGLKLHPDNPSFTQARDAIIAADIAINGGKDLFEIWSAFARRGLGQGSSSGASTSTALVTISTTLPMLVSSVAPATGSVVSSHPASYVVNVTAPIDPGSLQASDLVVNGQAATDVSYTPGATSATFTFAVDPVTAEGNQTIAIAAGAFTRASDASAVAAFGSNFFFDATPVLVTSLTPAPNTTVPLPLTTIDVNLNQAINPASVQNSDISISRGTVTGFSLLNGNTTVRFTVDNLITAQTITVAVAAGAFLDANGSPNAAFAGGTYTLVVNPAPQVSGVVVGDGTDQRSMVENLTVTFNQIVTFAGGNVGAAFQLSRIGGGSVGFQATADNSSGVTVVTFNTFSGADTQNGSLADGRFTLRALAASISGPGGPLNGGNDFVFDDSDGLYRFYGDYNGDQNVDIADFGIFSGTYNLSLGQTGFLAGFDVDNSNTIDIVDFGQFSLRYFTALP